jgi:hypothetical protein
MFHCHSTESDGRRSVADAVRWYAEHNYDVLAITDHNRLTQAEPPDGSGLLLVPGIEVDTGRARYGEPYHLVGIGLDGMIEVPRDAAARHALSAQEIVRRLRRSRAAVFAAHPYWSNLVVDDLLALDGIIGLEVFNTNVEVDVAKGDGGVHWDGCLAAGTPLFGIANDDTHWRLGDNGRAWTMLRMETLSRDAAVRALTEGAFYASTGAVFDDVTFDGETVEVRVGPPGAREIRFMCDGRWGHRAAADGAPLVHARFELRGRERFLRVEVLGPNGERAWTNPLLVRP